MAAAVAWQYPFMAQPLPAGPLVVAHRGASIEAPENTLTAFQLAAEAGADAVELDVRLTADGVPVVLHDVDVSSTTDGSGPVHTLTLAEVKRLDAAAGRGPREEIPTLAEALSSLTLAVDIEIKNLPGDPDFDSPHEKALVATVAALEEMRFPHPVLISSFNWITIERCRELAPDVATGFLTLAGIEPSAGLDYSAAAGHAFVLPAVPALVQAGPAFVTEAHQAGIRVGTWTVDDEELIGRLLGWGVDAVATNDPRLAVRVRDGASVEE